MFFICYNEKEVNNFMNNNGVSFVLDNFEKAMRICSRNSQHKNVLRRIQIEYSRIKDISHTGNMIDHFDKFQNGTHKYANDFEFFHKYGIIPNEEMSDYLKNNYPKEINDRIVKEDLQIGDIISNGEIMNLFKVTYLGCERYSTDNNLFVLISDRKLGYNNYDYNKGIIRFKLLKNDPSYRQNRKLINSKQTNTKIFAFEKIGRNKFVFFGEVEFDHHCPIETINNEYHLHFKRVNNTIINSVPNYLGLMTLQSSRRSLTLNPPTDQETIRKSTNGMSRDESVKAYTRYRANGRCDLCGLRAPFVGKDNQPFLECHHIIFVANKGPDRIYNTVALCPNCHRKMHNLKRKEDKDKLLEKLKGYLTEDIEHPDNLKYFNDLFGYNK